MPAHTPPPLRLMAIVAHPDDESMGFGGTLAKYASEGVETFLVTATRGESGRYRTAHRGDQQHPGPARLGEIRESELRAAVAVLGIREVMFLDYLDQELDRADPREAVARIVSHVRRIRPDVILTFGPDGGYGHPDHIAISQLATAAVAAAADASFAPDDAHLVRKLYYIAWTDATWMAYQEAFKKLVSVVDGVERQAVPWPSWSITTVIDTQRYQTTVWSAVACHASQLAGYEGLQHLPEEHKAALWGAQSFYRVMSLVNGGRATETDLFEGIRHLRI